MNTTHPAPPKPSTDDGPIDAPRADPSAPGSPLHPRHEQTFPTLTADEIERMRRFGSVRHYADREVLFATGQPGPGMFIVLKGHVAITQRDGLGRASPVAEQGPGQFLAEVGQLSGGAALVDGAAEGDVDVLLIAPTDLRRLMVAEAELGERIMRALILRRVALMQAAVGGPVVIGAPGSRDVVRLEGFLTRNGQPHHVLDPATDADARAIIARYAPADGDLPLVAALDGSVLRNPSEDELAHRLGMVGAARRSEVYDVAIVGAGPAGLSTAVYAASEGLDVIVLDARAFGGQAGASARIENYFGFPTGISGQALAGRAYVQAQKFGAEMMIPAVATSLGCGAAQAAFALEIEGAGTVRAKTVVVASGARYRRPAIERLELFEGRGVWYWASPIEARLCAGEEVMLVGGGNSAGQAAVYLSGQARRVTMLVRGKRLADSMSKYLVDRIAAAPNIELKTSSEVIGLEGDERGLTHVRWRDGQSATEATADVRNLFLFVGADPVTGWLKGCDVQVDRNGFVVTGEVERGAKSLLECSIPGVFAVGDVRSGSVKRVGAAIGEGAQVVQAIHAYLERIAEPVEAVEVASTT